MRIVVTGISGTKINDSVVPKLKGVMARRLGCSPDEIPVIDLEGPLHSLVTAKYLEFLNDLPRLSAIDTWSNGALRQYKAWQQLRSPGPAIMCLHATWQVRGHFHCPLTWVHHRQTDTSIKRLRPLHRILTGFKPDYFVNVIDNCFVTQDRLAPSCPFRLLEILRWRNVEAVHTDILAHLYVSEDKRSTKRETLEHSSMYPYFRSPCISVRQSSDTVERLLFNADEPRVYLAYPITKPRKLKLEGDGGAAIDEINEFRRAISAKFIAFDPVTIDERPLKTAFENDQTDGDFITLDSAADMWPFDEAAIGMMLGNGSLKGQYQIPRSQVREISIDKFDAAGLTSETVSEIDSQIVHRDYRLIDQSDGVIIYRPTYRTGKGGPWNRGGTFSEYEYASNYGDTGKPVVIIRDIDEDGSLDHHPFAVFYHDHCVIKCTGLSASPAARQEAYQKAAELFQQLHESNIKAREYKPGR